MSIANDQLANATNFNAAFVSKSTAQTVAGGKIFSNYVGTDWLDVATTATIAALSSANSAVRMTGSTVTSIQGITAGQDGQHIVIYNASSAIVTIEHENGSASAANRIKLPGSIAKDVGVSEAIELIYDGTQSRWVIKSISTVPSSSGSSSTESTEISNLGLSATVASNAMTIAIKTKAGTDPTGADVVSVAMRNATASTGTFNQRTITSALSMVISSGSTLGSVSANQNWVYVYLIDNAGTLELAVSGSLLPDEGSIISTTAEGGAGAADSKAVLYSTTARSNVPCRLVGRVSSTQATAGTWATSPSEISLSPFKSSYNLFLKYRNNAGGAITANVTNIDFTTSEFDNSNGAWSGTVFTAPFSGVYTIIGTINSTTFSNFEYSLYVNGTKKDFINTVTDATVHAFHTQVYLYAGDTATFRCSSGMTLATGTANHYLTIKCTP